MDAAVGAEVEEMRMTGEIVLVAVLEDEQSTGFEQFGNDERRQSGEFLQGVGRVGEDKVVLGATPSSSLYTIHIVTAQELEYIAADEAEVIDAEGFAGADDEVLLHMSQFDRRDLPRTARDALQTYTACAGKQVECRRCVSLEIDIVVLQYIEQSFLCKIGCWACLERARYVEMTSF